MWRSRVPASLWMMVALAAAVAACRSPEDKVHGWPRDQPLSGEPAKVAPAEEQQASETQQEATDAGGSSEAADEDAEQMGGGEAVPLDQDASAGPAEPVGAWKPDDKACFDLVEQACQHMGPYSQECIEARAAVPRDPTPAQLTECTEIVDDFNMTIGPVEDDGTWSKNPCVALRRKKCRDAGASSRICEEAGEVLRRLRRKEQRKICKGDYLLWEARGILRGRQH